MKLRTKFSFVTVFLVSGVVAVFGVFYIQTQIIARLHELSIKVLSASVSLMKVLEGTSKFLTVSSRSEVSDQWNQYADETRMLLERLESDPMLTYIVRRVQGEEFFTTQFSYWEQLNAYLEMAQTQVHLFMAEESAATRSSLERLIETGEASPLAQEVYELLSSLRQHVRERVLPGYDEFVSTIEEEILASQERALLMSFVLGGGISTIVVLLVFLFMRQLNQRIRSFSSYLHSLSRGNFSVGIPSMWRDEFGDMAREFNDLVGHLRKSTSAVLNFSRSITSFFTTEGKTMDDFFSHIVTSVKEYAEVSGVALIEYNKKAQKFEVRAVAGLLPAPFSADEVEALAHVKRDPFLLLHEAKIPQSHSLFRELLEGREVVVREPREVNGEVLTSFVLFPLIVDRELFGGLYAGTYGETEPLSELEIVHLRSFSDFISVSIDDFLKYRQLLEQIDLQRELSLAQEIQSYLLPSRVIKQATWTVATLYRPLWSISGDFFDVIPLSSGDVMIVIGDVSGKSLSAALVMVMVRTVLRLLASATRPLGDILRMANRFLYNSIQRGMFVTLSLVRVNMGERTIEYVNAGHHPFLLWDIAVGKGRELDAPGLPLGVDPDAVYQAGKTGIEDRHLLIGYTDGIIEATDVGDRQLGKEGLFQIIRRAQHRSPEVVVEEVERALQTYTAGVEPRDDQTLIVARFSPAGRPS